MKFRIWEDEQNKKHISLDGIEVTHIVTGVDVCLRPHSQPRVDLQIMPSIVEVEIDTNDVALVIEDNGYQLRSIRKE